MRIELARGPNAPKAARQHERTWIQHESDVRAALDDLRTNAGKGTQS